MPSALPRSIFIVEYFAGKKLPDADFFCNASNQHYASLDNYLTNGQNYMVCNNINCLLDFTSSDDII